MVVAADVTGWWIGYGVGAVVVVVVACVVLAIIVTAKRIAEVAEDATRSLVSTRDRTEALWRVADTNKVAEDILAGASEARRALSGDSAEPSEQPSSRVAQEAEKHPFPTGPQLDPELGT
jgi:Sec-independent protein translocase protein TatA